jgi:outer membrane protein TolC
MNRFFKTLLFGSILSFVVPHANVLGQSTFTLKEAIGYALSNSVLVKNSQLDVEEARAKVGETRGLGLPQVDAQFQVIHNIEIQRVILENDPGPFFNPTLAQGAVVAFPFQLRNNGAATLNANQLLFDGSYLVGLKAANSYKQLSERQLKQTREQVFESVTKAYYTALITKERADLVALNVARVDSFFRNTTALYSVGLAEKLDVDRLEVQMNNLMVERDRAVALVRLTLNLLKFQMNYPLDQDIVLSDKLVDMQYGTASLDDKAITYSGRIDYSILQTQRSLAQLELQNKQAAYLPKLYAFATYGYNPGASRLANLFEFDTRWIDYSFVGVQLKMNLFTGFSQKYRVQQARLAVRKAEQSFKLLESSIQVETEQARINMRTAINALEAQKKNLSLAEEVARVTKVKYTEGVGSSLEVTDAENALRQAQINYYAGVYDALIADIDFKKAKGLLDVQ